MKKKPKDSDDYRRVAYDLWNASLFQTSWTASEIYRSYARSFFETANHMESKEPVDWKPAGYKTLSH